MYNAVKIGNLPLIKLLLMRDINARKEEVTSFYIDNGRSEYLRIE